MRPWLLVGFLGQYDDMRQTSISNSFRTEGAGWMAGPYMTARLAPHLYLQARTAWGMSSNKVSPFLTYADTFDSTRWLLSSTLTGAWSEGNWQFTPSASLAYIDDQSEAYIDNFSVLIPSVETSLGQFRAEPEISYRHLFEDGTLLEPRLKASAIWNFESSASTTAFGGTLAGPEELRGKIEAGIGLRFNDGFIVDLAGSYDGIGSSEYDAHGVSLGVRFPFN
jgi:outer membrane autotransporter protein